MSDNTQSRQEACLVRRLTKIALVLAALALLVAAWSEFRTYRQWEQEEVDPPPPRSDIQVDLTSGQVVRRDDSDRVVWSITLQGDLRSAWPPELLTDADRVYIRCGDGVTALDWKTGKVLCFSEGAHHRLLLSGELLLAVDSRHPIELSEGGRWLVARRTSTGTIVFRVGLPLKHFSPKPIQEVGGLFLVQSDELSGGKVYSFLVDREGKVRHQFEDRIVDGTRHEDDHVFLTERNISRYAAQDKVVWAVSFPYREPNGGGGLLRLPNGDLIGFLYRGMADSGVQVLRLDPSTGTVAWQVHCKSLGVRLHSEYGQRATVTVEENRVRVTSKGSAGTFVEILDLASGKQLDRNSRWKSGWRQDPWWQWW